MNKEIKQLVWKTAKRKSCRVKTMINFCLAATVLLTGMYSCKSNNGSSAQQEKQQTDSVAAVHDSLQSQYNAAKMQVDDLTTKSYVLDSQVRQKDADIAKLTSELAHLRKKNRSLASQLKKDKKSIKAMKNEMSDKEREYTDRLERLQNDRDNIARERDSLLAKYHSLKELGSVLHASNIRVEGLHLKHNGKKEKKTVKARKLNVLRITFDIDENRIAEDGTKKLYLAILGPDGNLLSDVNTTGTITLHTGATIKYSLLKEVALKQNEPVKDVTADWDQDGEHRKGIYTITIYNGGYKIGSGSVTLK